MTLETFFENFDQFADAPGAVGKMRELILELAVHGRIVEQKVDDEPAAILMERLRKIESRLIGQRVSKKRDADRICNDEARS